MRDDVRNTLDEYAAYGHGNIKLKVTDPGDDAKKKERAQNAGVQELQVQVMKKDQVSVGKAFFGLSMNYLDKSEAIPAISDTASLEYELTTRLIKLTMRRKAQDRPVRRRLHHLAGTEAAELTASLQQVLAGEEGLYEVVELDPQRDTKLPEGLKAVIICGAWGMPDSLKYSIDQFLMKGGQVFVAMEPMMQAGQQMGGGAQAFPSLPTIEDQLKKYGVELDKKLIADSDCAPARRSPRSFGTLPLPYPLWPEVGPNGFNKKFAAVSKLEKLDLPWCCPLKKVDVPDVNYTTVAQTSEKAFTITSPFNLDPQQDWKFLADQQREQGAVHDRGNDRRQNSQRLRQPAGTPSAAADRGRPGAGDADAGVRRQPARPPVRRQGTADRGHLGDRLLGQRAGAIPAERDVCRQSDGHADPGQRPACRSAARR